jgi:hypothetical protein
LNAFGQLDPEKRRLIQIGNNLPLEGSAPIAGYGFYYYNNPSFINTNMTLRLAVAPIYLDGELGFKGVLTPETDIGIGMAGGGFGDTYSELRGGRYIKEESFWGHTAEISSSIYQRLNPDWRVPMWWIARAGLHHAFYDRSSDTADNFMIPDDVNSINIRTGFRLGGKEPMINTPVALELSAWYEAHLRDNAQTYGFGDRHIESASHTFWGRALLKYTFEESQQYFDVSFTLGTSINADRFSAYRLGGMLPLVSEFPLSIPGYFFQEISATKFGLINAEYSFPITPGKNWRVSFFGAAALVDYLQGLELPEDWQAGVGTGVTWVSPRGAWLISLLYGHGINSIRNGDEGSNQVGFLFQYDFDAVKKYRFRRFEPTVSPYGTSGGERIFH